MNRASKWSLIAVAVLGFLVVLVIGLLSRPEVTTRLAHWAVERFDERIPADVQFSTLSFDPSRGLIAVEDLALAVPTRPDQKLFESDQVILDVSMRDLLAFRLRLERLHLASPRVTIVHLGDNRYNFEDLLPEPDPNQPQSDPILALDRVTFEEGRLTYQDAPRDAEAELHHLKGTLGLDLAGPAVRGQVTFADSWVRYEQLKQPIEDFLARFGYADDALALDALRVAAGPTTLAVSGRIGRLGGKSPPTLALEGRAATRLGQWAPLVEAALAGNAAADFVVRGTTEAPRVSGTLSGSDLRYGDLRVASLETRLSATEKAVTLDRLVAELWGGRLSAKGTIPIARSAALDLSATATGLRLGLAQAQLDVLPDRPLTGTLSAEVTARAPRLAPEALVASGWVAADAVLPIEGRRLAIDGRTNFRWERGALAVKDLAVSALGGRITGSGQVEPLVERPTYALNARVSNLDLAALQAFAPGPTYATGRLNATIDLSGRGFETPVLAGTARASVNGTLLAAPTGLAQPVPLDADARLAFEGQRLRITSLDARAFGGTLSAQGTVGLGQSPPAINVSAQGAGLQLAALRNVFDLEALPESGTLGAQVRYAGETLYLDGVEARTLGGRVAATGRVGLAATPPRYDLVVRADNVDLAALNQRYALFDVPVTGSLGARLAVSGQGDRFSAEGPINAQGRARLTNNGVTRQVPLSAAGQVAVTPERVRLTPLEVRAGASSFTARGQIDMTGRTDLRFTGRIEDAPALAGLFGVEGLSGGDATLTGRATGSAGRLRFEAEARLGQTAFGEGLSFSGATLDLSGTLDQTLSVTGTLRATQATLGGQQVAELRAPLRYQAPRNRPGAGTLSVEDLVATLDGGRLLGDATINLGAKRYRLSARSEGLTLRDIDTLRAQEVAGVPLDTGVRLQITGEGALERPQLEARIALDPFTFEGERIGATDLRAELQDGRLAITGDLFDRLNIKGRVALEPGATSELVLTFDRLGLAPLLAMLPGALATDIELPVSGLVTGRIVLGGVVTDLERLRAEVDLSLLRVVYEDLALENQGGIRLSYASQALRIQQLHLVGTETDLRARGTLGLNRPSNLNAQGRLNLRLLQKVAPRVFADASGRAELEAQLTGTLGSPDLSGALTIRNGDFETRALPQAIRDLHGTVRVVRDRVFIDELTAQLGYTGRISAFGGATLGPDGMPSRVNVQLQAQEIAVRTPEVQALVSGELGFAGTPDATRLDGQLRVVEGRITRDVDLLAMIAERRTSAPAAPSPAVDAPFLRNLSLQLQVLVPGQFFIENNVADVELRGDVLVRGTLARPVPVGRVEVVDGTVNFQDRTYQLAEATVDFVDPHRLAPYVHLLATTRIQAYDVNVQANGTPENLRLDLTSTPFLPQTDVLALIATGQTPAELAEGGGSGVALASSFLLNQLAGGVERGVTGGGVVDVLRIQPGSVSPGEDTAGGSFTVGKRLNERLMITYTQDVAVRPGDTPGRVVIFDYLLTDQIVLNLRQNFGGGFNASARYRYTLR